jgi:hypothetical protein
MTYFKFEMDCPNLNLFIKKGHLVHDMVLQNFVFDEIHDDHVLGMEVNISL